MHPQTQLDLDRQHSKNVADAARNEAESLMLQRIYAKQQEAEKANAPAEFEFTIDKGSYFLRRKPRASKTLVKHHCELKLSSLVEALLDWYGINPRKSTDKTSLARKGVYDTATKDTGWMDVINGGIKMSVDSVVLNADGDKVKVTMNDRSLHGSIDGGHTLFFCLQIAADLKEKGKLDDWDAYVEADFYTGIMQLSEIAKMTGGHNTRNPIAPSLISNSGGDFKFLEENLKDAWFSPYIAWKGDGKISLQEIVRILALLDKNQFPDKADNPVRSDFESKTGKSDDTLIDLIKHQSSLGFAPTVDDESGEIEDYNNSMKILFQRALEILTLRDQIEILLFDDFRLNMVDVKTGTDGRDSILTDTSGRALKFTKIGEKEVKGKMEPIPARVKGKKCDMWTYSILSALRANLLWDSAGGTMSWIIPNDELLISAMPELIKALAIRHKKLGNKANLLREDSIIHPKLFAIITRHVKAITRAQRANAVQVNGTPTP